MCRMENPNRTQTTAIESLKISAHPHGTEIDTIVFSTSNEFETITVTGN